MGLALVQPAAEPAELRGMTALLRWRTRWLLRHLPKREAQAVQLIPALLQASFAHRELKGDPPGLFGATPRPAWVALARAFNLPPPSGSQRGLRLNAALFVVPTPQRLEVITVLERGIGNREHDRAQMRLDAVQAVLANERIRASCRAFAPGDEGRLPIGLLPFGCLVAGRLDAGFFDRLAAGQKAADVADLWTHAPTSLSRLALMFLASGTPAVPFAALWKMLEGDRPLALADPELFATRWAAAQRGVAGVIGELSAQAAREASTRRVLLRGLGHPEGGADAKALMAIGCAVARRLARVVRAVPPARAVVLRRAFRKEVTSDGLPSVLLPLLGRALRASGPLTAAGFVDAMTQIEDADGAVLGQGSAPAQAWIRALTLVGRAQGKPAVAPDAGPLFARLGARLQTPVDRRTVIAVIAASEDGPSTPNDPLNRGPERALAIREAMLVVLSPDGRPSARRLEPFAAVTRLIAEAALGTSVEVIGADGRSDVTAARLTRVVQRCRTHSAEHPLVIEVAGQALSPSPGGRVRRRPARTLAARPRCFVADPEAWDLGAAAAAGRPSRSGPRALDCLVWAQDPLHATVWYSTADGFHLSERVPFASLEQHMAETQTLVRAAQPPLVLAIRTAPEIAERISRFDPNLQHVVPISIGGSLPFGLTVEIAGERFGAGTGLSFRAGAETILSQWPPHVRGHLRIAGLALDGRGGDSALARLYARSLVLRRIWAHIERACRPEGPSHA